MWGSMSNQPESKSTSYNGPITCDASTNGKIVVAVVTPTVSGNSLSTSGKTSTSFYYWYNCICPAGGCTGGCAGCGNYCSGEISMGAGAKTYQCVYP
jgi:hypothetical protein